MTFLDVQVVEAISFALRHFVWQGAVIGGLLWIFHRRCDGYGAELRYGVSCTALILMLLAPLATGALHLHQISVPEATDHAQLEAPSAQAPLPVLSLGSEHASQPEASAAAWPLEAWIVSLWFVVVILLTLRTLGGWAYVRYQVARASGAPAEWQARLDALGRRMGVRRQVALRTTTRGAGPWMVGVLRPCIVVPVAVLLQLPLWQVEAVLAHELAHVRRHDYAVSLLQLAAETLLFFHPVVWWVSRRIRIEREYCCDAAAAMVCENARAYAGALVALEEVARPSAARFSLAAQEGDLRTRIRHLLRGGERPTKPAAAPAYLAAGLTVLLVLLTGLAALANETDIDDASAEVPPVVGTAQDSTEVARLRADYARARDALREAARDGVTEPEAHLLRDLYEARVAYVEELEALVATHGAKAVTELDAAMLSDFVSKYDRVPPEPSATAPADAVLEYRWKLVRQAKRLLDLYGGRPSKDDAIVDARTQPWGKFVLSQSEPVKPGSVVVRVDGELLQEGVHYDVDRGAGTVTITDPSYLGAGKSAHVSFEPFDATGSADGPSGSLNMSREAIKDAIRRLQQDVYFDMLEDVRPVQSNGSDRVEQRSDHARNIAEDRPVPDREDVPGGQDSLVRLDGYVISGRILPSNEAMDDFRAYVLDERGWKPGRMIFEFKEDSDGTPVAVLFELFMRDMDREAAEERGDALRGRRGVYDVEVKQATISASVDDRGTRSRSGRARTADAESSTGGSNGGYILQGTVPANDQALRALQDFVVLERGWIPQNMHFSQVKDEAGVVVALSFELMMPGVSHSVAEGRARELREAAVVLDVEPMRYWVSSGAVVRP